MTRHLKCKLINSSAFKVKHSIFLGKLFVSTSQMPRRPESEQLRKAAVLFGDVVTCS